MIFSQSLKYVVLSSADIGVIGLAVMGQNLILNMNDHGFVVCAFNRSPEKVKEFLENQAKNKNVIFIRYKYQVALNRTSLF
jgi:6-phosphogluconate dehydrogenase